MALNTHTTVIYHPVRKELNITALEYCFIDTVLKLADNRDSKFYGWCYASKQELANDFGITRAGLHKMIVRLEKMGLIEISPKGHIRHSQKWYDSAVLNKDSIVLQSDVNKVDTDKNVNLVYRNRKQSLHGDVNKVDTDSKLSLQNKEQGSNREEEQRINRELSEPETLKENKKTKKDTPAPRPAKVDYSEQVAEIVAHLNLKAKSRFRPDTKGTIKEISGRLKQDYTVEDFKTVIDFKCSQWLHDPKMAEYLRPETLFCEKHFEGYLNAANIWVNNGRPAATSPAQQRNQSVQKNQEDLARAVMANRKYYPPIEF